MKPTYVAAEAVDASDAFEGVDWTQWTVVLLKPDCLRRGITGEVMQWIREVVNIVDLRTVHPIKEQVFAHYDDMLPLSTEIGRNVPAELERIFVGQRAAVALGHGDQAAERLRAIVGPTDPAIAPLTTLRGRFAADSLDKAMAEGRLVDNVVHTSDHSGVVERDFRIWYGKANAHLLRTPVRRRR